MALFTLFPQRECSKRLFLLVIYSLLLIIYYVLFIIYYLLFIIMDFGIRAASLPLQAFLQAVALLSIMCYLLFIIYLLLLWTLASEQRVCPSKNSSRLPPRFGSSL